MKRPTPFQWLLVFVAAGLVGLSVYMVVLTVQHASAAADVEDQITSVESEIIKVSGQYDVQALQAELDQLEDQMEESQFPGTDDVENIEVLDLIISAEHNATIQVESFVPDTPVVVFLNGSEIEYKAYPYDVSVSAAGIPQLYAFLDEVETNAPYQTLVIDDVQLEYYPATEEEPPYWIMECDVIVYARM
ncbi:MAG: hypothetical protein SVP26_07080 [Chloroflexota bacterium]|nr:hypothetical protein [Chloroflexota bacterium]